MIKEIKDQSVKEAIAEKVLRDLPEWFGIETYTTEYIEKSKSMPFFAAYDEQIPVGFISLKETSKYTVEIYCMGVEKKYHRFGYGRKLVKKAEDYAKEVGYKFIQVKTVEQGKYDTYDLTNAFYKAMNYVELEVFPSLWDAWNPCQILIKYL